MHNFAVFLDRDGTLNEDPGYLGDPEKLKLFPGTGKALSVLKNKLNFKLIVISNQSGIARGLLTEENVIAVNNRINELLIPDDVMIDAFFYCPFHPDFSNPEDCTCRKPSPEMVFRAAKDMNISLEQSYFVGDAVSDIECGKNAGLKTILIKTGYGEESFLMLQNQNNFPTFVAQNILDVVQIIKQDFTGDN